MATRPFLRRGPSGPLAENSNSIIQVGFDQVVDEEVDLVPTDSGLEVPRSVEDPIRVILPDVTPGNYVLVTWTCTFLSDDMAEAETFEIIPIVTTDGTTTFPGTFQTVLNAASGLSTNNTDGTICGQGMFLIPDGVTQIVGELMYIFDAGGDPLPSVELSGIGAGGVPSRGCRLEMMEIAATAVAPPAYAEPTPSGFSTLEPVVP